MQNLFCYYNSSWSFFLGKLYFFLGSSIKSLHARVKKNLVFFHVLDDNCTLVSIICNHYCMLCFFQFHVMFQFLVKSTYINNLLSSGYIQPNE